MRKDNRFPDEGFEALCAAAELPSDIRTKAQARAAGFVFDDRQDGPGRPKGTGTKDTLEKMIAQLEKKKISENPDYVEETILRAVPTLGAGHLCVSLTLTELPVVLARTDGVYELLANAYYGAMDRGAVFLFLAPNNQRVCQLAHPDSNEFPPVMMFRTRFAQFRAKYICHLKAQPHFNCVRQQRALSAEFVADQRVQLIEYSQSNHIQQYLVNTLIAELSDTSHWVRVIERDNGNQKLPTRLLPKGHKRGASLVAFAQELVYNKLTSLTTPDEVPFDRFALDTLVRLLGSKSEVPRDARTQRLAPLLQAA